MRNTFRSLTASVIILGAFVAGTRQRIAHNVEWTTIRQEQQTSAAARLSLTAPRTAPLHRKESLSIERTDGAILAEAPEPAAFAAFDAWLQTYQEADLKTPEMEATGHAIALERRGQMAKLIQTNPDLALRKAIPYEKRKLLPPDVQQELEAPVSGYARYDVVALAGTARANGSTAIERYVTFDNRTYRAYVYGRRVTLPSAAQVPIHGIAVGEVLALAEHPVRALGPVEAADRAANLPASAALCPVSSISGQIAYAAEIAGQVRYFCHAGHIQTLNAELEAAEPGALRRESASQASSSWTEGTKTWLVIRANFPDDLSPVISDEQARSLGQGVKEFFLKNSYGRLLIESIVTPVVTLAHGKSFYNQSDNPGANFERVLGDARVAAMAAGYNTYDFDLDSVVVDGSVVSPRGYVGQRGATLPDDSVGTACHEIGHNLGLWHANAWQTRDGSIIGDGYNAEYANRFDTMGSASDQLEPFNTCHRHRLGWLPSNSVQTITTDGVYTLYPFDVSALDEARTYALVLRKDDYRDYWIETRTDLTGDLVLNWSPWYNSNGGTQLLDMTPPSEGAFYDAPLKVGRSFYDPQLGVKVIPLRLSSTAPGAVDVMVKHVHYLALPSVPTGTSETAEPNGDAEFIATVASGGSYALWCKAAGPAAPITIAVDDTKFPAASFSGVDGSPWRRIVSSGQPVILSLSPGPHRLHIRVSGTDTSITSIVLTDDADSDWPPLFAPISDQITLVDASLRVPYALLFPTVALESDVKVDSSDESVVPKRNIELGAEQITLTPAKIGQTTISLTATSPDGRSGTISFNVSVLGKVQFAINRAASDETIRLPAGTYVGRIVIDKNIVIEGASPSETIIDGGNNGPTFTVVSNTVVTLKNLTIRNGTGGIENSGATTLIDCEVRQNSNAPHGGGGIWNGPAGELQVVRSTISGNRCSGPGGGICNLGILHLVNSTVSGNRSVLSNGGGLNNAGQVDAVHCTIAFNRARSGGGVHTTGNGAAGNCIVAQNTADADSSSDLSGTILSRGFNLFQSTAGSTVLGDTTSNILGQNPLLGVLQNNGGLTATHALFAGSPAIDAGSSAGVSADQRGVNRVLVNGPVAGPGDGADIGAYEYPSAGVSSKGAGPAYGATLKLRRSPGGEAFISLEDNSERTWMLQVTSDFNSWQTLGLISGRDKTEFKDDGSRDTARRFYRVSAY